MRFRGLMFCVVNGLSRAQKRAVFLTLDMLLAPLIAGMVLLPKIGPAPPQIWILMPGLMVIAALASTWVGLPRIKLNTYEMRAVVATGKFAILTTLGFLLLCQIVGLGRGSLFIVEFFTALLCAAVASRVVMLFVLRWSLRNGRQRCRVLIYGAGMAGQQMAAALRNLPHIQPMAFLDDNLDLQALTVGGLPVLSPQRAAAIAQTLQIDKVFLAMPSLSAEKKGAISARLQAIGLPVQILPCFPQDGATRPPQTVADFAAGQMLRRAAHGDDLPEVGFAYADRSVLVTGAGGSVGSELCRQLVAHCPKRLVLYERSELALYSIERDLRALVGDRQIEIVPVLGSVTDAQHARKTMEDCAVEVVFHTAAYKHVPLIEANPIAGLANNVIGTRVCAEAAQAAGVARFVLISTDKAVRPTSVMGGTKRLAELLVQDMAKRSQQTQFSIVRFGNVLGSSGSVLPLFRDQIARGGPITLTDDQVTRYFMTIAEAARLVLVAGALCSLDAGHQASVFVLDMGQPVRIRDLAERMIAAAGLRLRDDTSPDGDIEIVVTGLRPGEKLHEELFIGNDLLPTPHPKILRAREACLSEFTMAAALNSIRLVIASGDQSAARAILRGLVEDNHDSPIPRAHQGVFATDEAKPKGRASKAGSRNNALAASWWLTAGLPVALSARSQDHGAHKVSEYGLRDQTPSCQHPAPT